MTHAKPTQGHWWIDGDGFVASGSGDSYVTLANPHCSKDLDPAEREANAHIFAAGKIMLAELETDLDMMIDLQNKHLSHTATIVRALLHLRIEATRAAIAAAKGDAGHESRTHEPRTACIHRRQSDDHVEGHITINREGRCTITLIGAASMTQVELDDFGSLIATTIGGRLGADRPNPRKRR